MPVVTDQTGSSSNREILLRTVWLCLLPYAWVVSNAWESFTGYSLFYISAGIILNTMLLVGGCWLTMAARSRYRTVSPACLPFLATTISVSASFLYNVLVFMPWSQSYKVAALGLAYVMALAAIISRRTFQAIAAGLCLAVALAGIQTAQRSLSRPSNVDAKRAQPAVAVDPSKRPNIYLLMFDAMSGSYYYQETFKSPPPWASLLIGKGFREVRGARSSRPYSVQSVIDILHERPMTWHEFGESPARESAGLSIDSPSSAIDRAHELGYRVAFMYQNNYFGRLHPLQNLDAYYPDKNIGLCSLAPIRVGFHLCRGTNSVVERLIGAEEELGAHQKQTHRFIEKVVSDGTPWITWSYIAVPEHTSLTYRDYLESDRHEFQATHNVNSQRAVAIMEDYLTLIHARDPKSIVLVFGDHGLIRSRGWLSDERVRELFSTERKTEDERSIGMFVQPSNFCAQKLLPGYPLENLLGDLLRCIEPGERH